MTKILLKAQINCTCGLRANVWRYGSVAAIGLNINLGKPWQNNAFAYNDIPEVGSLTTTAFHRFVN